MAYLRPQKGRRPAVIQANPGTFRLAIFVGWALMIVGLAMVFTRVPEAAAWGAVVVLAGGIIATVSKVKELIA